MMKVLTYHLEHLNWKNYNKFLYKHIKRHQYVKKSKENDNKNPRMLMFISNNSRVTVMENGRKSIIGRLFQSKKAVQSFSSKTKIFNDLCEGFNFGDKGTIKQYENGTQLKMLKRAQYTCGVIKFKHNQATLVHMNYPERVIAILPNIKKSTNFEPNCLYLATVSNENTQKLIPNAEIIMNLGTTTSPLSQLHAHIMYCGLNDHVYYGNSNIDGYNDKIESWEPNPADLVGRRSFLDECVITIDPISAADFDDALSLKQCMDGSVEIGVHIADVTHFVKPGSKLDDRANKLCSSIYAQAKTFHMLPDNLSKEKCSLKPGQLRLTYSIVLKYSPDGNLLDFWIGKGYIRSAARLTYEQAEDIIHSINNENMLLNYCNNQWKVFNNTKFTNKDVNILVKNLYNISTKIWNRKVACGRYDFESKELKFDIDPNTLMPISMYLSKNLQSHRLVETLMCAANETVATFLKSKFSNGGTLLRIHSIANIQNSISNLINHLNLPSNNTDYNLSLKNILTNSELTSLKPYILISVLIGGEKSIYVINKNNHMDNYYMHGALASPFYTHFTSPIRRYADIIVHRQLDSALSNHTIFDKSYLKTLDALTDNININEKQVKILETIDLKYNLHLYMKKHGNLNITGGKVDDPLFTTDLIKLFYPDIQMCLPTKLLNGKQIQLLETTQSLISTAPFPHWVSAVSQ